MKVIFYLRGGWQDQKIAEKLVIAFNEYVENTKNNEGAIKAIVYEKSGLFYFAVDASADEFADWAYNKAIELSVV